MPEEKYRDLTFKQWIMQPESMIGISALILSLCGLFISFYEASLIREYQRASVWPHVEVGFSFQQDNIAFHISNTGIGPARIKAANVSYKGEIVRGWAELKDSMKLGKNVKRRETVRISDHVSTINSIVLPPNIRYDDIFRLDFENRKKANEIIYQNFRDEIENGNINITVCYCSVYEQCWITEMIDSETNREILKLSSSRQVESCKNVPTSDI